MTTAKILINYIVITVAYVCLYGACRAQNVHKTSLSYEKLFQPYCGYTSVDGGDCVLLGIYELQSLEHSYILPQLCYAIVGTVDVC